MRKYPFKRKDKASLITIPCRIGIDTKPSVLPEGFVYAIGDKFLREPPGRAAKRWRSHERSETRKVATRSEAKGHAQSIEKSEKVWGVIKKNRIFAVKVNRMEVLTIEQIKAQYPDQWVLVGSPVLDETIFGSILKKMIRGIVLFHSKDKHEVAYKGKDLRVGYDKVTLIFTGEIPKKRKFWL